MTIIFKFGRNLIWQMTIIFKFGGNLIWQFWAKTAKSAKIFFLPKFSSLEVYKGLEKEIKCSITL